MALGGPVEGELDSGASGDGEVSGPGGDGPDPGPLQAEGCEGGVQRVPDCRSVGGGFAQGTRPGGGGAVGVGDLELDRAGELPGCAQVGAEVGGDDEQGTADLKVVAEGRSRAGLRVI